MWYPSHWHCQIYKSGNTSANDLQILDSYQRQAPVARRKWNGHTVDGDVVVLNQRRVVMQIRPPQEDPKAILHTRGRTRAEIAEIDPGCQAAKPLRNSYWLRGGISYHVPTHAGSECGPLYLYPFASPYFLRA
jgi:hypothetical protein